ncbi:hypothetical protein SprV_0802584100 [Sparganum proliferum]
MGEEEEEEEEEEEKEQEKDEEEKEELRRLKMVAEKLKNLTHHLREEKSSTNLRRDVCITSLIATWKNTEQPIGGHKYSNSCIKGFKVDEYSWINLRKAVSELFCNLEFAVHSQCTLDSWIRNEYEKLLLEMSSSTGGMICRGQTVELIIQKPTKTKKSPDQALAIPTSIILGALKEAIILSSISVTWPLAIAQSRLLPADYESHCPAYEVFAEITKYCTQDICEREVKNLPTPIITIFSGTENAAFGGKCHFIKALLLIPSRQVSMTEFTKGIHLI